MGLVAGILAVLDVNVCVDDDDSGYCFVSESEMRVKCVSEMNGEEIEQIGKENVTGLSFMSDPASAVVRKQLNVVVTAS